MGKVAAVPTFVRQRLVTPGRFSNRPGSGPVQLPEGARARGFELHRYTAEELRPGYQHLAGYPVLRAPAVCCPEFCPSRSEPRSGDHFIGFEWDTSVRGYSVLYLGTNDAESAAYVLDQAANTMSVFEVGTDEAITGKTDVYLPDHHARAYIADELKSSRADAYARLSFDPAIGTLMAEANGATSARWQLRCPNWLRVQVAAERFLVITDKLGVQFSSTENGMVSALAAAFGADETQAAAVVATMAPTCNGRFDGSVGYRAATLYTFEASPQRLLDLVARLILRADAESRFDTVWFQRKPLTVFGPDRLGHHLLRSATGPSTLWYDAANRRFWPGPGWGEAGDSVELYPSDPHPDGFTIAVQSGCSAPARYRVELLFENQAEPGLAYRATKI